MKKIVSVFTMCCYLAFAGCVSGQETRDSSLLDPLAFSEKAESIPGAVMLDVRTPEEYRKGHVANALNFNWNDPSFGKKVAKMDKESPVFVYCLSGGRSAEAAKSLREQGFAQVYEMKGGIMKWRAANLPLATDMPVSVTGMSMADFEKAIDSPKKVLVDFYAEWCAPCKKMEPFLKEIEKSMTADLKLVRIDIDANPDLASGLKIDALPLLHLYQDKKLTWSHSGYLSKQEILKKL